MRLSALLVAAVLTAAPAQAQQESSDLPVSLDKIRKALAQPQPRPPLERLDQRPMFRVVIQERQRIEELLQTLTFDSGPAVPGGLYAYEQQQSLFPKVNNPLAQPYGAFSQGELIQVSLTTLIASYLAGHVMNALTDAERARAQEAAREEVRRAIEEYWTAQGKAPPAPAGSQP